MINKDRQHLKTGAGGYFCFMIKIPHARAEHEGSTIILTKLPINYRLTIY